MMPTETAPLISIIIPVFNAESTLEKCIHSLISQTYSNIELIFIDDCSTDGSCKIIDSFLENDSRICIIHHDVNKGVAEARNTGLSIAKGQYIYFVDADDFIELNSLELISNTIISTSADLVGVEWLLSYAHNERHMKQPIISDTNDAFKKMCCGLLRWNLWLFAVKRSIFEDNNLRFIPNQNMGEDMMMMGKVLSCAESITMIHSPLYHYVQTNSNSLTKEVSERHLIQVQANLSNLETYLIAKNNESSKWIPFLKLNIKLPLLFTGNKKDYYKWLSLYPEANKFISQNKLLPKRTRVIQSLAAKQHFGAIKIYYIFVYKFIYGIVYR